MDLKMPKRYGLEDGRCLNDSRERPWNNWKENLGMNKSWMKKCWMKKWKWLMISKETSKLLPRDGKPKMNMENQKVLWKWEIIIP